MNKKFPLTSRTFFNILLLLLSVTILSIILVLIIRGTIGAEVFLKVLLFPSDFNSIFPLNLLGLLILILGIVSVVTANFHLLMVTRIGLQAREPFHIPSTLVTTGPYRYSRNPIYLGVVLLLLGFGIFFVSITVLICAIALFLLFWKFFVRWEEKILEEAFGEEYLLYKNRVRRWL